MRSSDQRPADLEFVAHYARFQLAFSGLWQLLFGLVTLSVAFVPAVIVWISNQPGSSVGEKMPWPLVFAGLIPLLITWGILPVGVMRLRAAFEQNCFLRAGPRGLELRMPVENQGWRHPFRYRVGNWVLPWSEFADVVRHTTTVNGIPTGSRIRLMFRDNTRLTIERCYFREGARKIQDRLLTILRASG